jgi:phage gp45-like
MTNYLALIKNCLRLIKNLFKIAKLLSVDDSGDYQFMTVTTLGKTQKVLSFKPYGLMSSPPAGSMIGLWSQQGQESNGIGIADDPKNRIFTDMAEGEVALGNYITASSIIFDENGDAILATANDALIAAANDVTLFSGNDVNLFALAGKCTVTGATIDMNGTSDNLVTWADLSSILSSYWTIFNLHSHVGAGAVTGGLVSFDITASKATTLRTNG